VKIHVGTQDKKLSKVKRSRNRLVRFINQHALKVNSEKFEDKVLLFIKNDLLLNNKRHYIAGQALAPRRKWQV